MRMLKTTPVFFVERIEPHLPHWRDRLGYELVAELPHGAALGFVILSRDGLEVMLQTFASGEDDLPAAMPLVRKTGVGFYNEVESVDAVQERLGDQELLAGPRTTSYGMKELWIQDPAGFVQGYACKA